MREGGYDHKVNETVSVFAAKTTELGQMTWGIMRGVMAMTSQKVELYTKDGLIGNSSSHHDLNHSCGETGRVGYQAVITNHARDHSTVCNEDSEKDTETKANSIINSGRNDSWAGWDDKVEDDDHFAGSFVSQTEDDGWGDDSWDAEFK